MKTGTWLTLVALGIMQVLTAVMLNIALPQWDVPGGHTAAITVSVITPGFVCAMIGFWQLYREDEKEVPENEEVRIVADLLARAVDGGPLYGVDPNFPTLGEHSIDYIEEWEDGARAVIKHFKG